jgi:hypothetical protein
MRQELRFGFRAMQRLWFVEFARRLLCDTLQIFRSGDVTPIEISQFQPLSLAFQECSSKHRLNDASNRAHPAKALPIVISLEAHLPNIGHVLFFTTLWTYGSVDVMPNFMEKHIRKSSLANKGDS